eukprot:TRINITY_DN7306_c0_g1_i2.p1 TRINITY_DN7306_c0_g1~~TRINITY_DN7306_c0_g1_i2.p1  ORF type:complete len:179 (-),score=22.54 TRINITY_DN7306_c0_g1_i2:301-837(-)
MTDAVVSIQNFADLFASKNSSKIIHGLIPSLKITRKRLLLVRLKCKEKFALMYVSSDQPTTAAECLQAFESLSFRTKFALHYFRTTKDKVFFLGYLRNLTCSMHYFFLGCSKALLTFSNYTSSVEGCLKKEKQIAKAIKVVQVKSFEEPLTQQFAALNELWKNYTRQCFEKNSKENHD